MANIALFGATGRTGGRVLQQAVAAGHDVTVLVRDPAKLPEGHGATRVVVGDVRDAGAVADAVTGNQVVLGMFGQVPGSPRDLQTEGTAQITAAMAASGARRIVTLSGGGLSDPTHDRPKAADRFIRFLLKRISPDVLADAESHLEVLRDSGLDWTVVRAGRLTDRAGTGTTRVGWVGVGTGISISRDDLAAFVLTQVDDRRFIREMPFVSS